MLAIARNRLWLRALGEEAILLQWRLNLFIRVPSVFLGQGGQGLPRVRRGPHCVRVAFAAHLRENR